MPRRPRYLLPEQGIYHVTGHAVDDTRLLRDDVDRRVFLALLKRVLREFGIECLGWCLMGTHYHLLLRAPREEVSVAMHRLNGRHAHHHNLRHGRRGHLFGDRFSAHVVRDDDHFERACAYIEANPVKAGLCETVDDWPWTWLPYRRTHGRPAARGRPRPSGSREPWRG